MNKKILSLLLLSFFLFGGLAASAQETNLLPGEEPAGCTIRAKFTIGDEEFNQGDQISSTREDWGIICTIATVQYITNWIFYLLIIAVMVMILYGAFIFLTSSGNPEKTSKATKTITFAVIGMVVALLARAVPSAVRYITGIS